MQVGHLVLYPHSHRKIDFSVLVTVAKSLNIRMTIVEHLSVFIINNVIFA